MTSLAAAGVVLAGKALKALVDAAGENRRRIKQTIPAEHSIQPVSLVRGQYLQNKQDMLDQFRGKHPEVESIRTAVLASIANTPFYVTDTATLQRQSQQVQAAVTKADLQLTEQRLLETLATGHRQVFADTLAIACQRAAVRIGFPQVEVVRLPKEIRVIAADTHGRCLVSEIHAGGQSDPAIATEVVGVLDGSCQKLLDDFDRSLEEEGVQAAPPNRKFTGGVCELATAREIARDRWKPLFKLRSEPHSQHEDAINRARRLNKPTITLRSKE
jgi:hypothetical protein